MIKKLLLLLIFIPFLGFSQSYSVTYSFTEQLFNETSNWTYYLQINNRSIVTWGPHVWVHGASGNLSTGRPTQVRIRTASDFGSNIGDVQPIIYAPADGHCFDGVVQISDPNGVVINLSLQIEPNFTIDFDFDSKDPENPKNTYPNTCETLTVSAPPNYTENLYNWEYRLGGGNWEELPAYQGMHTFEMAMGDIPGLSVNQTIRFRVRYCSNRTSENVNTHFIICSPGYTDFEEQQPMCFYNQGGFTITFSRALDEDEEIGFNLFKDEPSGEDAIQIDIPSINSLPENNTYTFNGLEASGDYFLTYQSLPDGSVSSLIDFKIDERTPVEFTATGFNINCFGGVGSIQLDAEGGVGGYQYQLNGGNWEDFTNPLDHTINDLPPADYQVKVRDANECISKILEP